MPRYIDADKLEIDLYQEEKRLDLCHPKKARGVGVARSILEQQPPADVQEVIYCKNCKNYLKFENGDVVCEEFGGYIKDNDFCSRGERKDGKD